ncbi:MAG: PAS domain S-box protein [Bacillota bacterium]
MSQANSAGSDTGYNERELQLQENIDLFAALIRQTAHFAGSPLEALPQITELSARVMGSERVSIWFYNPDYSQIYCHDLYELSKETHSSGDILESALFPEYCRCHSIGKVIAAEDVYSDPRTARIPAAYYRKTGIVSLLDAPVWVNGKLTALLSFEHTGEKRRWLPEEELLALTLASRITACIEAARHHEALEELRQSEGNLAVTLQSIGDGVIATDPAGRITRMNPTAERLTGWLFKEAVNRPLTEVFRVVNAQTGESAVDPVSRVLESGRIVGLANHTLLIARDGTRRQIADSAAPIRDAHGNVGGVVMVFSDVTDEYAAREAVRRSEAEKSLILNSTAEIFAYCDRDLRIRWANNAYGEMLSQPPQTLVGRHCYEIWYNRSEPCAECPLVEARDTGHPRHGEVVIPDGRVLLLRGYPVLDEGGAVTALIKFGLDITDRKRAEEALDESQQRLHDIIESLPDATFAIDMDGKVIAWNRVMEKTTGIKAAEILGRGEYAYAVPFYGHRRPILIDLVFQPDSAVEKSFLSIKREADKSLISESFCPMVGATGTYFWAKATPLYDRKGNPVGVIESIRDINEQMAAEEAVRQSREWYRTMVEDIPALLCRLSPDKTFTFANDAYCRFMGKKREEIIGDKLCFYIPPDTYKKVERLLTSLTPDQAVAAHEHANQAHDGQSRWIRWSNRALFDREGVLLEYLCIGEDITEQKQVYDALQASEILKGSIVEAIPDMLIRFNRHGRYLDILHHDPDKLYYPLDQMLGKTVDEVLPAELARNLLACIERSLQTGQLQTIEYSLKTPAGLLEFEARCIVSGANEVVTFVRDITEEKKVAEDLRKSEERYREILASIEEGYYEVDLTGKITFCNEAACQVLGYQQAQLQGMSFRRLFKDPKAVFNTFKQVFVSERSDRAFTTEIVCKGGSTIFGEFSISPIRNKEGSITGFRGVVRDITERIRVEEQLRYLSLHDQLTGLYNRTFFEAELKRLDGSRSYPITIISADLDGLKLVNDTIGHIQGDQQLIACAGVLRDSIRGSDILARVGGDEFTAILPRTDDKTGEKISGRIRENIALYNEKHAEFPLSLSLGVATIESGETSLNELFKRADDLMYRDKLYRSDSARSQIVQALLAALAERDYITEGHAQRLAELCRKVGIKLNLTTRQLSDLALLAQVHDLGKVGIPDSILFKKGSLTEEEWEIMRRHPEKGYRIAVSSPDIAGVADLILKHHERWDGTGYPLKLKGREIPVECRILAIVDAYDAMTHERPYSKVKTKKAALAELKRCAGIQFDPELVKLFLLVI